MGDHGFVQNHATDVEVSVWKSDGNNTDSEKFVKLARKADDDRLLMQRDAANKAAVMLKQSGYGRHPYLKAKGFEEEEGNIYVLNGLHYLLIPMRVDGRLVGCQVIDEAGGKKFLFGQRTSNAEFCFDNKGLHILCEGYATALSVRHVLKSYKRRYNIHVCFSAGNMKKVASTIDSGFLVTDNDESGTGERVAKEIGWPYWMSDVVGEDFNDTHLRVGLFRAGQSLIKAMGTSVTLLR
jgi:putative DNA primase/helicase